MSSTNLQIRHDLSEIGFPEIRIRTSVMTYTTKAAAGGESGGGVDQLVEACRTPTSFENKIPQILTCPPAPRKPKRKVAALSCKRKLLDEFQFFEIANREEVESFFRSSFEQNSDSSRDVVAKRRCKCT
ncbi:hypothetical protein JRO89_XS14G0019600 [Xanthoceras sorbifolium]|uniref:Uncharacterized protein n=1 Tax=Xanthoceras sorbifolium TaxID=99658 RepID=A0ABQ8H3E2_9ROSI|nr:hypothetical protein JRO89_XS14G0019600 [Xanthoceras sorbifolium]